MKRTLTIIVLMMAVVLPVQAQTPEARVDQTSIDGTGISLLQPTDSGQVAVTNAGSSDDGNYIQFAVHNSSDEIVSSILVKAEIRDASGAIVATTTTSARDIRPQTLAPGEFAIGRTFISGDIPQGFQLNVFVIDFEEGPHPQGVSIEFGELNIFGDRIAGEFINTTGDDLEQIYLVGVCFDSSGRLVAGDYNRVEEPMLEDVAITFSLDVAAWRDAPCDTFVIAG